MRKSAHLHQIYNGQIAITEGCFRVRFQTTLSSLFPKTLEINLCLHVRQTIENM